MIGTVFLFFCLFLYFIQFGNIQASTMSAKHNFIIPLLNSDIMDRN